MYVAAIEPSQQERDIDSMSDQYCPTVYDAGATLTQHWVNGSCLLGWFARLTLLQQQIKHGKAAALMLLLHQRKLRLWYFLAYSIFLYNVVVILATIK